MPRRAAPSAQQADRSSWVIVGQLWGLREAWGHDTDQFTEAQRSRISVLVDLLGQPWIEAAARIRPGDLAIVGWAREARWRPL